MHNQENMEMLEEFESMSPVDQIMIRGLIKKRARSKARPQPALRLIQGGLSAPPGDELLGDLRRVKNK